MKVPKITIRKFEGDDSCSWAVFKDGVVIRDLTGLNRSQAQYYRDQVRDALSAKGGD